MNYPSYCKDCIHKIVCKYVDNVIKWDEEHFPAVLATEDKMQIPMEVKCDAKETIETLYKIKE